MGSIEIQADDLPKELRQACDAGTGPEAPGSQAQRGRLAPATTMEGAERSLIADALGRAEGNVSAAARLLGVTRNTLRYRMRKYGLESLGADGGDGGASSA